MPMDASSVHCPNCGAAVEPDAGRCPYCRARLATVSCPQCFALVFEDAEFCVRCGARRARAEGDAGPGRCPGCHTELQAVTVDTTSLQECPACDGVWIEAADFERICADRESQRLSCTVGPPGRLPRRAPSLASRSVRAKAGAIGPACDAAR
jgi:hypothetical protein